MFLILHVECHLNCAHKKLPNYSNPFCEWHICCMLSFPTQGDCCPMFLYQITYNLNLLDNTNKFLNMQQSHKWLKNTNSRSTNRLHKYTRILPFKSALIPLKITRTPQTEVKRPAKKKQYACTEVKELVYLYNTIRYYLYGCIDCCHTSNLHLANCY